MGEESGCWRLVGWSQISSESWMPYRKLPQTLSALGREGEVADLPLTEQVSG